MNFKKIVVSMLFVIASGVQASSHFAEYQHLSRSSNDRPISGTHEQQLHTQMSIDSNSSRASAISTDYASVTDEVCADGHCLSRTAVYMSPVHSGLQLKKGAVDRLFGVVKKTDKANKVLGRTQEDEKVTSAEKQNVFTRVKNKIASGAQAAGDLVKSYSQDDQTQLDAVTKIINRGGMSDSKLRDLELKKNQLLKRLQAKKNLKEYYTNHPGLEHFYQLALLDSMNGVEINAEYPLHETSFEESLGWATYFGLLRDKALEEGVVLDEEQAVEKTRQVLVQLEHHIQAYEQAGK